jgi:gamma-glutamyltranspeptidase/glutathione hydrolase
MLINGVAACTAPTTRMGQTEGPTTDALQPPDVALGAHGMVASDAPLAAEVGVRILMAGGNAVDAAIATAFALAVVYPEAGNIGGGGFFVGHFADGSTATLDFREVAPLRATRDMYVDAQGNVTDQSLTGHLASGVPGSVAGLWALHQKFGSKPWRELILPAIDFAHHGFVVDAHVARVIGDDSRLMRFPASAWLLPEGQPPAVGTLLRNPDLAATLGRIAEQGRDGFYKGETADLIVAEMKRGGGLISHEDLAQYQPKWRAPIEFTYRGQRVISMAPASSGGVTLALMGRILGGYDLASLGATSPERYHLIAEASRRAFADRNYYLGDPDVVKMPLDKLLSDEYAAQQRATISRERATPSRDVRPGLGELSEGAHTTHFSVVDAHGNAVALTTTINELHGSAVTVTGAGFLLNDEMDDFTSKVGVPNLFGLVQGEANAIVPGKRMLSAMTPTIVLDETGKPLLITGARGGPRIISAVFQIISNVVDHHMGIAEAVLAPRVHHQHLPDSLYYEAQPIDDAAIAALERKGHHVARRTGYIGAAPTIMRVGHQWAGVPDTRSGGIAKGY